MAIDGSVSLPLLTLSGASLHSAAYGGDVELPGLTLSGSLDGPKALPALTLSGTAINGAVADGDAFLPAPTVSGAADGGMVATGDVTLPGLTLNATTGTRGDLSLSAYWISLTAAGVAGTVSKGGRKTSGGNTIYETQPILPGLTLSGAMRSELLADGDAVLDAPTLSANGIAGAASDGDVLLRAPRLSANAITGQAPAGSIEFLGLTLYGAVVSGALITGTISLPHPTLDGSMPLAPVDGTATGDATLDALTLSGTVLPGWVAEGGVTLRAPTLEATLSNAAQIDGDIQFAEFTLSATANLTSNTASAVIRIPELSLSADAVAGNAATASIELPLFTLEASTGAWSQSGTGSITLPLLQIGGDGEFVGIDGGTIVQTLPALTVVAIAVNTRTRAVTNYDGIVPNSVTAFNGVTLMATADGIVALTGDTDAPSAAQIDAYFTSGKTDFNQSAIQRVLTGYVGYWASGELELTLITDDHHEHVYTLAPRQIDGEMHASRVKFGRGVKGMYWQFKAANVDGADFGLDRLELHTASTGGRV